MTETESVVNPPSSTPQNLRVDRAEFDRRIAERLARGLPYGHASLKPDGRESPSVAAKREAMAHLAGLRSEDEQAWHELERELDAAMRQTTQGSQSPGKKAKHSSKQRTPERQAQIEQTRMWAGSGKLPPHVRKRLTAGQAAIVSRMVDIIHTSVRKCCDWATATIAKSAGQCRRQVQRVNAMIAAGEIPGLSIARPVNRGPEYTDTNVVTLVDTKPGKRLHKWQLNNPWKGRLFDQPKEIIRYPWTETRGTELPATPS